MLIRAVVSRKSPFPSSMVCKKKQFRPPPPPAVPSRLAWCLNLPVENPAGSSRRGMSVLAGSPTFVLRTKTRNRSAKIPQNQVTAAEQDCLTSRMSLVRTRHRASRASDHPRVMRAFFHGCSRSQIHSVIQPVRSLWCTHTIRRALRLQCMASAVVQSRSDAPALNSQ